MPTTWTAPWSRPDLDQQEKQFWRSAKLEYIHRAQEELSIQLTHSAPEEIQRIIHKKTLLELDARGLALELREEETEKQLEDMRVSPLLKELLNSSRKKDPAYIKIRNAREEAFQKLMDFKIW